MVPTLTTHTNHHSLWNHSNPLKKQKVTVALQQHKSTRSQPQPMHNRPTPTNTIDPSQPNMPNIVHAQPTGHNRYRYFQPAKQVLLKSVALAEKVIILVASVFRTLHLSFSSFSSYLFHLFPLIFLIFMLLLLLLFLSPASQIFFISSSSTSC